ncbi:peptide chain release factor 1 [Candidatus Lariskella endosymbiont of Hedychridium roseum]|uniref:peptide chain release factor 1 n=1 Tax=Candidatus Lariskella endosymbiont of Hedychridium roseum TaxID=3077949 RepID=UPI0030CCBA85
MDFSAKLLKILERYEQTEEKLLSSDKLSSQEFIKLSKERAELDDIVSVIRQYNDASNEYKSLSEILESDEYDQEFKGLAKEEKYELQRKIDKLSDKIKVMLIPKDIDDDKDVILEVRAGTGGEEAALFAAVLFGMYQKYAEQRKWKFEILSLSSTGLDGYKEASASISGKGVFARLKFESGVHRVQRVPETESSGRIHTSAATVAVLPEAEEVDLQIDEKDCKIDVYRASGAGGQHVNTTDSAVRITHIPTGLVVCQQDEKSQHKNKAKAFKILRARIYDAERSKKASERAAIRKDQIGSGDRSERIRTYNYPQSRVTDHRINLTVHSLNEMLNEGKLDPIIDPLISDDCTKKLAEL